MAIVQITPPAAEPVSLADQKAHLRVFHDDDDALITGQIAAARQMVERYLGQSLVATTFDLLLDGWPAGATLAARRYSFGFAAAPGTIEIPGPVLLVSSVNYIDPVSGDEVELDASAYAVDTASNPARIEPGEAGWPATAKRVNGVRVRYVAGYAPDATGVPDALKQQIKTVASGWFENRESVALGMSVAVLPWSVQAVLDGYRNWSFDGQ